VNKVFPMCFSSRQCFTYRRAEVWRTENRVVLLGETETHPLIFGKAADNVWIWPRFAESWKSCRAEVYVRCVRSIWTHSI